VGTLYIFQLRVLAGFWLAVYIRSVYISMPPQKRTINEELVAQYENKEI
jgi:hypothetical protein